MCPFKKSREKDELCCTHFNSFVHFWIGIDFGNMVVGHTKLWFQDYGDRFLIFFIFCIHKPRSQNSKFMHFNYHPWGKEQRKITYFKIKNKTSLGMMLCLSYPHLCMLFLTSFFFFEHLWAKWLWTFICRLQRHNLLLFLLLSRGK